VADEGRRRQAGTRAPRRGGLQALLRRLSHHMQPRPASSIVSGGSSGTTATGWASVMKVVP
jgi:hypothetical protein